MTKGDDHATRGMTPLGWTEAHRVTDSADPDDPAWTEAARATDSGAPIEEPKPKSAPAKDEDETD